jgi:hypothetical protein
VGITGAGRCADDTPDDDWEKFEKEAHAALSCELALYRVRTLEAGKAKEIVEPSELDKKLQVAALYVFSGMDAEELGQLPAVARDTSVVNRWLNQVLPLLGLEMRPRGHRSKQA